jgi:CBS domain-containing protein
MHDVAEFLSSHEPFRELEEEALEDLARRVEVEFFAAGTTIVAQDGNPQDRIRVVRRGTVELVDRGRVIDLLGEGEMFGHPSMLSGMPTGFEVRAEEDTLCYAIGAEDCLPLLARPAGLRFLGRSILNRPRPIAESPAELENFDVETQSASALAGGRPILAEPELTVRDAVQRMESEGASSVLVQLGDGDYGIVTDRDLRSEVIAAGRSTDAPLSEVMTAPALVATPEQTGAELMLLMLDHGIRQIPVVAGRSDVLGVVRDVDLLAAQTRTPFMLRRAIVDASDGEQLGRIAEQLNLTVVSLHRAGLAQNQISSIISVVFDALIRRMIEIAVEQEGPPPAEFAWFALGSDGRREAVPSSDVDSGMSWGEGPDGPEPTREYMKGVADRVADSLSFTGWQLDPHGVTASGQFAASSIEEWRRAIGTWLSHPEDERVLIATSILLDGRAVSGPSELDPKAQFFEAEDRETLLRWMLRLALAVKPPTGFRRNLVVEGSGQNRGTLDIKRVGLHPVVDIARYAALKARLNTTSTVERLRGAARRDVLKQAHARTLAEAFDLFMELRLEHQVQQLERGEKPDDHLDPSEFNSLTRRYLRDAFREVTAVQKELAGGLRWARG